MQRTESQSSDPMTFWRTRKVARDEPGKGEGEKKKSREQTRQCYVSPVQESELITRTTWTFEEP